MKLKKDNSARGHDYPSLKNYMNTPARVHFTIKYRILSKIFSRKKYHPNLVTEQKWNNLIVLDGCRYDVFSQNINISGKLTNFLSPGSSTPEWLTENFSNSYMDDVIYISASPYGSNLKLVELIGYNPFFKVIEVWRDDWDDVLGTVHPEKVNRHVLNLLELYPDKRLLIHYMQPHYPFIGKIRLEADGMFRENFLLSAHASERRVASTVWHRLRVGKLDVETAWRAYISNLELVLKYVEELIPNLHGKSCITSDHGNVFGKYGVFYGHPNNIYLPELIEVPWFEIERNG